MKILPVRDKVIVEPIMPAEAKTAGGIIIPDSAKREFEISRARVIAANDKDFGDGVDFKPGNIVCFYNHHLGNTFKYKDKVLLSLRRDEILFIET